MPRKTSYRKFKNYTNKIKKTFQKLTENFGSFSLQASVRYPYNRCRGRSKTACKYTKLEGVS